VIIVPVINEVGGAVGIEDVGSVPFAGFELNEVDSDS